MNDEQARKWREIVDRCGRMEHVTLGSAPRRDAVLAVDAELRRLQALEREMEGWSDEDDAWPAGAAIGAAAGAV